MSSPQNDRVSQFVIIFKQKLAGHIILHFLCRRGMILWEKNLFYLSWDFFFFFIFKMLSAFVWLTWWAVLVSNSKPSVPWLNNFLGIRLVIGLKLRIIAVIRWVSSTDLHVSMIIGSRNHWPIGAWWVLSWLEHTFLLIQNGTLRIIWDLLFLIKLMLKYLLLWLLVSWIGLQLIWFNYSIL